MPRPTRDERRAERAATARTWGLWLADALSDAADNPHDPIDTKTLIERARALGATFDKSNVSHWLAGDTSADPANAVLIARVLHQKPADALRAAGHTLLADELDGRRDPVLDQLALIGDRDMAERMEADYRRDLAAAQQRLEKELAKLRQQLAPPEAGHGAGQDTA